MKKRILITGGSGLVGTQLSEHLLQKGYEVNHLSRKYNDHPKIKTFIWDIENKEIDPKSIDGVDTIIHLAGAGIAEKRWSKDRKELIIKSRTESIALLYKLIKSTENQITTVISASGSGFYSDRGDQILTETDSPRTDFLSQSCVMWEKAVDEGKTLNLRIVKFRLGNILAKNAGALPTIALPIKLGIGSALGNGKQWISWIHIEDAVRIFTYAIENTTIKDTYNAASPNPTRNNEFNLAIAKQLNKPYWAPAVPTFVLKVLMGEMSILALASIRMNVKKIEDENFVFSFPVLQSALKDIYK